MSNLCHPTGPQPKGRFVRDKKYLRGYHGARCIACGRQDDSVIGAHIRTGNEGGTGFKPSDDLTLPLCVSCHADQEAHPGPNWWIENVLKAIARRRYVEFGK